jgi:VCBS repeat-containing protein
MQHKEFIIYLLLFFFFSGTLIGQNQIDSNPLAYWKLNDLNASIIVDETGDYNGVGQNSPLPGVPAVLLNGFRFFNSNTSNDQFILLDTTVPANNGNFTLGAWVNPASNPDRDMFIFGGGIGFCLTSELKPCLSKPKNINQSSSIIPADSSVRLNQWTHIAVSYDSTAQTYSYYINGNQAGSGSWDYNFNLGIQYIGQGDDTIGLFDGKLDDLRIYAQILSDTDIAIIANHPPLALSDSYLAKTNTTLTINPKGVLKNDLDYESDTITSELLESPTNGVVTLNSDGSFKYTPNVNFSGDDTFSYIANDGKANLNSAIVSINVADDNNNSPIAVNDSFEISINNPLLITVPGLIQNDYDPDSDILSISLQDAPLHGILNINNDGLFTYMPESNFEGNDSFTYFVNDGLVNSNLATVNISVSTTNENHIPYAINDYYSLETNSTLTVLEAKGILSNDIDSDADNLNCTQLTAPAFGDLTLNADGSFTYSPGENYGKVEFTYTINDGTSDGNIAKVIFEVTDMGINHQPLAIPDSGYSVNIGDTLSIASTEGILNNDFDIDGDAITAIIDNNANFGNVVIESNGAFEYEPPVDYTGTDWFSYHINDGSLNSQIVFVKITVLPKNLPPVAENDSYTVIENTVLQITLPGVLENDLDPESLPLQAVKITDPLNGILELNTDGSFTYTPNSNYSGTDSFTYVANDGHSNSQEATVNIIIEPSNKPPVVLGEAYYIHTDTVLLISAPGILGNDSDPENDQLSVSLDEDVKNGSLILYECGAFSYLPNIGFIGTDNFTYTVTDGITESETVSVLISVESSDTILIPSMVPEEYFIPENTTLNISQKSGVLINDIFKEISEINAVKTIDPLNGELQLLQDGSFSYLPEVDFTGKVSFSYRIDEKDTEGSEGSVKINIIPTTENSQPTAVPDCFYATINTILQVPINGVLDNDIDIDGDSLSAELVDDAEFGIVYLNSDGSFEYEPEDDFIGTDWFSYTVSDGNTTSNLVFVKIIVSSTPKNIPPTALNDNYSVSENTVLHINFPGVLSNDSDPENNIITAVNPSLPTHGTLTLETNGAFTYTPEDNFIGDDSFTYQAFDDEDYSSIATVNIKVTPAGENNPPIAQNDFYKLREDQQLEISTPGITENDTDPNGDSLSVILVSSVSNGTLTLNSNGSFLYIPDAGFTGNDTFVYYANDGLLNSENASVTIEVIPNQAPSALPDAYSVTQNDSLLIPANGLLSNDIDLDGDLMTVSLETDPLNGEVILYEDGSFLYIPNIDYIGTDTFTYTAEDDYDFSEETTVTIDVLSPETNKKPISIEDFYFTEMNQTLNVGIKSGILSNDIPLNSLNASIIEDVLYGTLTLNPNGSYSYTPSNNFIGTDRFTYIASDETLQSEKMTVYIKVSENELIAPTAIFDQYITPQGKNLFISSANGLLENDILPDKDNLTVELNIDTYYGYLTLNEDGSFEYEPEDENFTGIDFFSYKVTDGIVTSYSATVMITITPNGINNPPQAFDDFYTILENSELKVTAPGILSNDIDSDDNEIYAIKVSDPLYGILNLNADGSFTYKPTEGFSGNDSFTYYSNDSELNSLAATVNISVKPAGDNNAPIAQNDSYSVAAGGLLKISIPGILANDYDPDGDDLTINLIEDVNDGTLTLYDDGSFEYESDADEAGEDWFTYNVIDSNGTASTNATVLINLVENHAPTTLDDAFFTRQGLPLIVSTPGILSNDTDLDNESLIVTSVDDIPIEEGELILNDNGSFVFIPSETFTGTTTFTYYAEDALNESNISTVTISVAEDSVLNVPPTALKDVYYTDFNSMLLIPASAGLLTNDIDVDSDNLSVIKISDPSNGTLTLNTDGSIVYFPNKDFNGIDSFSYKINDGDLDSNEAKVFIHVNSSDNKQLIIVSDYYILPQNTISFIPAPGVINNDLNFNKDSMTVELEDDPYYGYITLNPDGSFEYEPEDEDFTGLDWFSYYIETPHEDSQIVYVTINVQPKSENIPPIAQKDTYYSKQDVDLVIYAPGILANDYLYDPSEISITLKSIPIRGFITLNNDGSFTYTPTQGFFGQDKFDYSISNGTSTSNTSTVYINIISNNENAPPVANPDLYTTTFNKILNIPAPGILENDYDPDDDSFEPIILEEPYYGTITLNSDGSFEYEPEDDFAGKDWFTYMITDSNGLKSETSVVITIEDNNPPKPVADTYKLDWNTPLRVFAAEGVLANDIDVDGDKLFAYVEDDVSHGYLDLNEDGSFEYEPDQDFYGDSDWFTYYVDDGTTESEPVKVTLKVAHQNITLGSLINIYTSEINNDSMDVQFLKTPKIYGVFGNAQRAGLKKLPKDKNPMPSDVAKATWKKKYSLFYNTRDIKEYGYSGWFAWNTLKPVEVNIWIKYKTADKISIEESVKPVFLAPPRFETFIDSAGNPIDLSSASVKPGSIIIVKGKYFGDKAPKVSFEMETENETYKYIKLKVLKDPQFPDFKGNPNSSYMNIETGESIIKIVIPTKKIQPGETYPLIIDNKIGVAADFDGNLPEISIE